jgi:hypothetical protein
MLISAPKRTPSHLHTGHLAPTPRREVSVLALGGLLLAATGCSFPESSEVRTLAASDFQCDDSEMRVEQLGASTYLATGCGQSEQYTCSSQSVSRGRAMICARDVAETRWRSDAPPTPPQLLEPPSGAGGFAFGASEEETRRVCERAGHVYAARSEALEGGRTAPASCDGVAAEVGGPAHAALGYCAGKLCAVSLRVELPENENLAHGLARWRDALTQRYGGPSASHAEIPDRCLADVAPCLRDRTGTIWFDWQWRSHRRMALAPLVDRAPRTSVEINFVAGETTAPTPGL